MKLSVARGTRPFSACSTQLSQLSLRLPASTHRLVGGDPGRLYQLLSVCHHPSAQALTSGRFSSPPSSSHAPPPHTHTPPPHTQPVTSNAVICLQPMTFLNLAPRQFILQHLRQIFSQKDPHHFLSFYGSYRLNLEAY